MKYFLLLVIILIFFVICSLFFFKYRLRRKFFRAYILRSVSQYLAANNINGIFSNIIILDVADLVFKAGAKEQEKLLKSINSYNYQYLIEYVHSKNVVLGYALEAHFDFKNSKSELQKYVKTHNKDGLALLVLALIYDKEFDYVKLRQTLKNLVLCKLNKPQKISSLVLEARIDMQDSDMLSASKKLMLSIKIFKKYNLYFEEAASYVMLGEIYRISAFFDVSQTMYESAEKIYLSVSDSVRCADVKALKGLLMIAQERFDEAKDNFSECKKVFSKYKLNLKVAEILNQQALICILQNKYAKASDYANKALLIHKKYKNGQGQAFSFELLSLVFYKQRKYEDAIKMAESAMPLYVKLKNNSGFEDASFLAAQSYFAINKYEEAENLCRSIVKVHEKRSTCFHIANVYSLLGLIYIKMQDLSRATALFKQALNLEQCNERYSGAALDYANLAFIEKLAGRFDNALLNLKSALENAQKFEDSKLCTLIETQINEISQILDNK